MIVNVLLDPNMDRYETTGMRKTIPGDPQEPTKTSPQYAESHTGNIPRGPRARSQNLGASMGKSHTRRFPRPNQSPVPGMAKSILGTPYTNPDPQLTSTMSMLRGACHAS